MDTITAWLSQLTDVQALIRLGGYTALMAIVFAETGLLAGFFLPGDSLLVTAGLVAAVDGTLSIWWLIVLLSAAAVMGDSTGYAIGHYVGPRLFRREDSRFFHKDHLVRTQRFYEKYGVKTIVIARFVPIVRTFAPTIAGVGKMRYRTFLFFNVIGGIGWVISMTLAGYFLGEAIPNIERQLHWVIGVVILLSFLPLLREWRMARRHRRPVEPPGQTRGSTAPSLDSSGAISRARAAGQAGARVEGSRARPAPDARACS